MHAIALKALQRWWAGRAPRERRGVLWAAWCLAGLLTWWLVLAPPLRTLREADAIQTRLGSTLDQMQQWQMQARALQKQPAVAASALVAQLRDLASNLGPGATLQIPAGSGGQATLNLKNVPVSLLAAWLADPARVPLQPLAVHLTQDAAVAPDGTRRWSGSLIFSLPDGAAGAP